MGGLGTFARLGRAERSLALRALLLVAAIRISLWILTAGFAMQLLDRLARLPVSVPSGLPPSRFVWAVLAASRRIPGASCLTQSLALSFLLARAGKPSRICLGVAKDPGKGFQAHAWVECGGETLLTTPLELEGYSPLFDLKDQQA